MSSYGWYEKSLKVLTYNESDACLSCKTRGLNPRLRTILFEKHAINGQSVITFWLKWQESEEKLWKMIFKIVKFKFKFLKILTPLCVGCMTDIDGGSFKMLLFSITIWFSDWFSNNVSLVVSVTNHWKIVVCMLNTNFMSCDWIISLVTFRYSALLVYLYNIQTWPQDVKKLKTLRGRQTRDY